MPRQYSSSARRQVMARLRPDEPVAARVAETGIRQATLFRWKRQALIDAGVVDDALHHTPVVTERMTPTPLIGGQQPRKQLPLSLIEKLMP